MKIKLNSKEEKMKNKSGILIGLVIVSVLFLLPTISAVHYGNILNITRPGNSSVWAGTQLISIDNSTDNANPFMFMDNCTVYAMSSLTANNSWVNVSYLENTTVINCTGQVISSILEDSNDYTINITCMNYSKDTASAMLSSITINNTVPTAPTALTPTAKVVSVSGTETFSSTVTDSRTTGCTYSLYKNGALKESRTGTYSGSTCSFGKAFTTSTDYGQWYPMFTASDGTNTATSTGDTVTIAFGGTVQVPAGTFDKVKQTGQTTQPNNNKNVIIAIIIGIGLLLWAANKK